MENEHEKSIKESVESKAKHAQGVIEMFKKSKQMVLFFAPKALVFAGMVLQCFAATRKLAPDVLNNFNQFNKGLDKACAAMVGVGVNHERLEFECDFSEVSNQQKQE